MIDEDTYNSFKPKPKLSQRYNPLYSYNSTTPLPLLGKFEAQLMYRNKEVKGEIVVVKGHYGNLLSYKTCRDLGLVMIMDEINEVEFDQNNLDYWKQKYPDVFSGEIGKLKDFQLSLHIDKTIQPVKAKQINHPLHLQQQIKEEVKRLLDAGIIEKVVNEPSEWLSETVVVAKKDSAKVRLCVDMKAANRAIKRVNYQMPTIENIIQKTQGMKFFNKVDLMWAFQQIELDPACRYISRFRTPDGNYQYTRLFFGVNTASEVFHQKIEDCLQGLPAQMNAIDDIVVMGRTREESSKNVNLFFQRLSEKGLTVNPDKCMFDQTEIVFFGLKISPKGVSLCDQKIEALKAFKTPSNASELLSFLGLAVYASRWIKDLATLSEPLRQLTRKGVRWSWTVENQNILDQIKSSVIDSIRQYDITWRTGLTVDASPVGISGVLTQTNPNNPKETGIVTCISRILSDTEKRYSQIEKEALAPVWAMERLSIYLLGHKFKLFVDNQAVAFIYKNPLSKPPARILRWQLRLTPYDFEVIHIPGKGNVADFLSRYPITSISDDWLSNEENVNSIVDYSLPKHISNKEIIEATDNDKALSKLRVMIQNSKFIKNDPDVAVFGKVFETLALSTDGLIIKDGYQIVIPLVLQDKIFRIAHEGHLGIAKTKQLLRS